MTSVTPVVTTRPRLPEELVGTIDLRFVGDDEFDRLEQDGAFVETVVTGDPPHRFGLPGLRAPRGHLVPVVSAPAGLLPAIERHHPGLVVYQIETDYELARHRAAERHVQAEALARQLRHQEDERRAGRAVAERVFADRTSPDDLVRSVLAALEEDFPEETARRKGPGRPEAPPARWI